MTAKFEHTEGASLKRPFIVALTGGIASGKSTVSRYLNERYHIPIIDTDVIARQLVEVGSITLSAIREHFGQDIVDDNGELNRRALRNIISQNPDQRTWLNALMHPRIYAEVVRQVESLNEHQHTYVMVVIPLLSADSPYLQRVNQVWVVDCTEQQQKQRLVTRDQMNEISAEQLIHAQPSRAERLALANHVILNDSDASSLMMQTDRLHHQLTQSMTR